MTKGHTLEEHRDYLYEIVKLKLFFVHHYLSEHPEESFRDVIRNRVDIYRKTDANTGLLNPTELFFDDKPWLDMENAAYELYKKYIHDRDAFEREAFEVFKTSLDARCERDYLDDSSLKRYQCGSLRYDIPSEGSEYITFHIANSVSPKSIFTDKDHLVQCFMMLMDIAEKSYHVKYIRTGTWLNMNPRWLELFPQEWLDNLSEINTDVKWHYGFWGQFISARGTFNAKYGEILRTTGRLPFYLRTSFCSIEAMRKHLEDYLT